MIIGGKELESLVQGGFSIFLSGGVRSGRSFLEVETKGLAPNLREMDRDTHLEIHPYRKGQIEIVSADLTVGEKVIESDILKTDVTLYDLEDADNKINLREGEEFVLECDPEGNKIYYIVSFERIFKSDDLSLRVDSKSTTGRVGAMSHYAGSTDGRQIIAVQPYSFPLKVTCGKTSLSQIVVRRKGSPYMSKENILESGQISFEGDCVSLEKNLTSEGLLMLFNTELAYEALKCEEPIDMDAKGTLDWEKYFRLIEGNQKIVMKKKTLYLLGSLGVLGLGRAAGFLSRESKVHTGTGLWGHFAGIIHPGFRGGITMEAYSHVKAEIRKEVHAGEIIFDYVEGVLDIPDHKGPYQGQKPPRLPKMFKSSN